MSEWADDKTEKGYVHITELESRIREVARGEVVSFARLVISRLEESEREHTARGGDAGLATWIAGIVEDALQAGAVTTPEGDSPEAAEETTGL